MRPFLMTIAAWLVAASPAVHADAVDDGIAEVQRLWAVANYETPPSAAKDAFARLTEKAKRLAAAHPERAEPKVWLAIVLSSDAGVNGGLAALGKVKRARRLLEEVERVEPEVLDGSVFTSLGSLYYRVPGWPIGFGDDDKAETYLRRALAVNPDGVDPNYFYGDFLIDQKRPEEAIGYLEKARAAPPRPGRESADRGRQAEIDAALARARAMLGG